jgi:predicted DNA-binding mobile mystery protein A
MKSANRLALKHINSRLSLLSNPDIWVRPKSGWIHYIRTALGMTLNDLGKKTGVTTATIAQAERNELLNKTSLATLQTIAEAMDCNLVYAFVPKTKNANIEIILKNQAVKKATEILSRVDIHMELENQKVKTNFKERVEVFAQELLEKGKIW